MFLRSSPIYLHTYIHGFLQNEPIFRLEAGRWKPEAENAKRTHFVL